MNNQKAYLPLIAVLQFVFLLFGCWGCAAKEIRDNPAGSEAKAAPFGQPAVTPAATGTKIITDETGTYEVKSTPFGLAKKRIAPPAPQAESVTPESAPPASKDETVQPALNMSPPSPPADRKPAEIQPELPVARGREPKAPSQGPGSGGPEGGGIVFNFDDADLYEVIRTFADILKINYMVEPGIKGKVTIQTAGRLTQQDVFPVFHQILEANGLAAVKEGRIYNIVPIKEVARLPLNTNFDRDMAEIPPGERIIIQIVPLKYVSSQEMTKLLTPFISSTGTILAHGEANTLLIMDKGAAIQKALALIDVFDIDMFDQVRQRFFILKNMDVEEMVKLVTETLSAFKGTAEFKLIPVSRLSAVLAITKSERMLKEIEGFIVKFDVPGESMDPRLYVYNVKNGMAGELTQLLNSIFGAAAAVQEMPAGSIKEQGTAKKADASVQSPFVQKQVAPEKKAGPSKPGASATGGSGTLRGEIKIVADEIRNAIIIEAIPQDYHTILDILKQLDTLPRQVLIEAVIAEINLNDKLDLGVEWTYIKDHTKGPAGNFAFDPAKEVGDSILKGTLGGGGLTYSIEKTNYYTSKLAASAQNGKANILASPSILASDNKEASINITTEVPLASSEFTQGTGTDRVVTTNVQFRNTGVILSVTPHINERGLVNMDVSQEVSEKAETVLVSGKEYPSFRKRMVKTNLTVGHDQTIVIGGLINEVKDETTSGLPFLSRLPYIGFIFGKESDSSRKSELIAFITPRVITNLDEVDAITHEFREKVGGALKNRQPEK